jgi:hypothetical protein
MKQVPVSDMEKLLVALIGCIFKHGSISESLRMGLLTPVFKIKGTRQQAINYRGITVLPVVGKIVENVIKCRTNNCEYTYPLRRIGHEYSANVASSTFQSFKRIQPLPVWSKLI